MFGSHLVPNRISERHAKSRNMKCDRSIVIGYDSETMRGPPITFQFYSREVKQINGCHFIGERKSAIKTFLNCLKKLKPGNYRMYGHNLEFDMLSALWECRAKIRDGNILLKVDGWEINGRYSKPVFAVFTDGKRNIELVDSFLWFQTSLEKAAKIVCPQLPKLLRPAGLGETRYDKSDTGFVKYALRDAEVAYFLGMAIEKFHEELGIPSTISLASMAASVFKQNYMKANIYQPPLYEWMVGAAAASHGGVNRVRPGMSPAWHKPVTSIDLSSAYPYAMSLFPDFSNAAGYKPFKPRSVRGLKDVPELGIYKISGTAAACDWSAMFDHDFKPLQGKFKDIWVTGFELNEALSSDEVVLTAISGYYYDSESEYSPFKAYVDDAYAKKNDKTLDKVICYMWKILMNALTGKFIQTSPDYTLVDGQLVKINRAGGLYHPFIYGLITGHTRSVMHPLEHKYQAIHTATDGIFAPGHCKAEKEKTLGAAVVEGYGDLALFRNKFYILYTDEETEDTIESQAFSGKHILKFAKHGFQGTVGNMEQMLVSDNRQYKTNKPLKLKTALKKGEAPNNFVISTRNVRNIGEFKVFNYGKKGKGENIA